MSSSLDKPKPDEDHSTVDILIKSVSRNPFVARYFDAFVDFIEKDDIEDHYGYMPDKDVDC